MRWPAEGGGSSIGIGAIMTWMLPVPRNGAATVVAHHLCVYGHASRCGGAGQTLRKCKITLTANECSRLVYTVGQSAVQELQVFQLRRHECTGRKGLRQAHNSVCKRPVATYVRQTTACPTALVQK